MPTTTATPQKTRGRRPAKQAVAAPVTPPPSSGYVDTEHPGSRIRRVRTQTIDAVEAVRQNEDRPAGASARPWTETLDRIVHAGLIALGHPPLFPEPAPEPEPVEAAAAAS